MTGRWSTSFRLAVFDVAGTTVIDGDAVVECLVRVVAPRTPVSRESVVAVMGLPKPVAIRQLLASPGLPDQELDATVAEVHRQFRAAMIERYRDGSLAPADGVERVFATLQDAGVRVALDTGFSRDILDAVIERLEWAGTVDFAIASDEVSPGDSIPYRFINPATPCSAGPCSTKSRAASPGACNLGRTPL